MGHSNLRRGFEYASEHLGVLLVLLSVLGAILGYLIYDISLLQPLEKIAWEQAEYRRMAKQIDLRKRMVERHISLGNSFLNTNQDAAAEQEFETALRLDPNNTTAQIGVFKASIFMGIREGKFDPEIAKEKIQLILDEYTDDPHALVSMGRLYLSLDSNTAIDYFQRAVQQDAKISAAYYGLGLVYDMQEGPESSRALEMFEKASAISPWNQSYLNNLAEQYAKRGEYERAVEKHRVLLKIDQRYLLSYFSLADLCRLQGKLSCAYLVYSRLIEMLQHEAVRKYVRNKASWYFLADDKRIPLHDYPEKTAYAYYSLAFTAHLLNESDETSALLMKANNLKLLDSLRLKALLASDARRLKKDQPSYTSAIDGFLKMLQPSSP